MTKRDFQLIAQGFADAEAIIEHTDVDGIGMSSLRIAADAIGGQLKQQHPRFNAGVFQAACFPIAAERMKQSILATLAKSKS
jgi:hypothetical protein